MTQQKLPIGRPRRPKAKRDMFGASANKHVVGQTKLVETEWRRDLHIFTLTESTPSSGERSSQVLVASPGEGFTREIRRVALHGGIAVLAGSTNTSPTNTCGVVEIVMGLAESVTAFEAVVADSEASGMFRRYVTFAQSAGAFKFWIPSGFNQMGTGAPVQGGGPWQVYIGSRIATISRVGTGLPQLVITGVISTQEKETRVY